MLAPPQPKSMQETAPPVHDSSSSTSKPMEVKDEKPLNFASAVNSAWIEFTKSVHSGILKFILALSLTAARHPKRCLCLVSLLSIALITTGILTNFEFSLDDENIFAPWDCLPRVHSQFMDDNFPPSQNRRPVILIVHADGENVMHYEAMKRLFEATDAVRNLKDFDSICTGSFRQDPNARPEECTTFGPTVFWNHDKETFEVDTHGSDLEFIKAVSQNTVGGIDQFVGNLVREQTSYSGNGTAITFAQSLSAMIELPAWENGETQEFEIKAVDAAMQMKEAWEREDQPYRLEVYTVRTIPDELTRAVSEDIPLIPVAFGIMTIFSCLVFVRRDAVQSRMLLGVGSVITILCSIMSGFGLVFIFGVPFTSMTQILPFVIFGVGLDDTYIITGAYFRTDPSKDPVERIRETMEEVGASISLTTITTVLAFILGWVSSSIPVIQWLCLYAFPTIAIDFIFQITFFISIMVLDEQRVKANRLDCCICYTVKQADDDANDEADDPAKPAHVTEQFMRWYSRQLLRPAVKVAVLVVFAAFTGACAYSSTQLTQAFSPNDFLPSDSYGLSFLETIDAYTMRKLGMVAVFSGVDQSDPDAQEQMLQYLDDLSAMPQIQNPPEACWIKDFMEFRKGTNPAFDDYSFIFEGNYTFNEQLELMLSVPEIRAVYGNRIVRNEDGDIIVSQCLIPINYVSLDDTEQQIQFLADLQRVTAEQPINQGKDSLSFFSHDGIMFIWEFYSIAMNELVSTAVSGIIAVSAITFLLIPHWSAVTFVLPFMAVLYLELVGTLNFAGLTINPLTYIILVMSIGLLVDYIMHILLRYYESTKSTRQAKVVDTLESMGSSILIGGLSTCLGVAPLALASSGIIRTVFTMFIAMVTLGLSHGLILLPVILSYVGPEVCVTTSQKESDPSATTTTSSPLGHRRTQCDASIEWSVDGVNNDSMVDDWDPLQLDDDCTIHSV